jgi:uncharacterized protein
MPSRSAGKLHDTDTLIFAATITPEVAVTTHGRDAPSLLGAGLAIGLSPGFRIPPKRAVAEAERIEEEPDDPELGLFGAPSARC